MRKLLIKILVKLIKPEEKKEPSAFDTHKPIRAKIKLKKSTQYLGDGKWLLSFRGEPMVVPSDEVWAFAMRMEDAMSLYSPNEIESILIERNYQ